MSAQLPMFRDENRYDVWSCAKCGRVSLQRSIPHNPPSCCGTGMWFQEIRIGSTYQVTLDGQAV